MNESLTQSSAWRALEQHHVDIKALPLSDIILKDAGRIGRFQCSLQGLHFNYALHAVTQESLDLLVRLAQQQNVEDKRDQMFSGKKINVTEHRAVLHTALRQQDDRPVLVDGHDIIQDIRSTQKRIAECVGKLRQGLWLGATGKPIRHIVNIGIGGSDLGPRFAARALDDYASNLDVNFVANADAYDLTSVLMKCDPESTLFIVVSKTFTTQETLLNARSAREWLLEKLGRVDIENHFIAVSANNDEVRKFGIPVSQMFPMWDWVGGRYSLWSAVGLSLALAIGMDNFQKLLEGAALMDTHFRTAPLAQNMPVLLALLGIWQRNFWHTQSLAILSYSEKLREFPRYLQQLEMESNGKSVTRDGKFTDYETAPVLFGECGTVGQHSFHQLLHQGSNIVPVDFIGIAADDQNLPTHHHVLLANMVAQAGAFAFGQPEAASPHDVYVGGRPSSIIVLDHLDPFHFGMLLALYEHKTFVQGVVWNINSFDQPGVELGKRLAQALQKTALAEPASETSSLSLPELFLADFLRFNFPNLNKTHKNQ